MAKLIKWDFNWADEMDVVGFKVFTDEEYDEALKSTLEAFDELEKDHESTEWDAWPIYRGVGSNQEIEIKDREDYMNLFSTKVISDKDYECFMKHFNGELGDSPFPYEY